MYHFLLLVDYTFWATVLCFLNSSNSFLRSVSTASNIFVNTNLVAAISTCVTMIYTWIRYKKPDVSMTFTITKQSKFEALKAALNEIGVTGMTVTQVLGCGVQKSALYRAHRRW